MMAAAAILKGRKIALFVGLSVTVVSPAKTAEPIEICHLGPKEPCIRWGRDPSHTYNV